MELSAEHREFFERHHGAAMTTLRADGTPHTVRIGCALMGDVLWSSGNRNRLRTRNLRRDPRATLMVFDSHGNYLTAEARVRIIESDDIVELSRRYFGKLQHIEDPAPDIDLNFGGRTMTAEEFRQFIIDDERLLYEFEIVRTYGSL